MLIAGDDCDVNTQQPHTMERQQQKEWIGKKWFLKKKILQLRRASHMRPAIAIISLLIFPRICNCETTTSEKEQRKEKKIRVAIVLRLFCAVVKCYFASQVKSRENYYSVSRFAVSFFALCVLGVWCTRCTDDHDHRFVWNEEKNRKMTAI